MKIYKYIEIPQKKRMQVNLSFLLYLFFLRVWRIRAALDKVWVRKTPVCFWSIFSTFHDHLMNLLSMVPHVLCSIKISWTYRNVTTYDEVLPMLLRKTILIQEDKIVENPILKWISHYLFLFYKTIKLLGSHPLQCMIRVHPIYLRVCP